MINRKGQALVEFVLVLPIIILLLLAIIDIGTLFIKKSEIEDNITDIIYAWKKESTSVEDLKKLLEKENYQVETLENTTTNFVTIKVKTEVSSVTPINKKYEINIKRVVPIE